MSINETQQNNNAVMVMDIGDTNKLEKIEIVWDIRTIMDTVLRVHDSLTERKGSSIPLHPEEIANLLQLKEFVDGATKHALRRCLCNSVYCRSPEKLKPCIFDSEEIRVNPQMIYTCRWRGKRL